MLELYHKEVFELEVIIQKMAHNPAIRFKIDRRGFLEEGYYADVVIADPSKPCDVTVENIISKCGWSPFLGYKFRSSIEKTIVSGKIVYDEGKILESGNGERLLFKR
jgi:dihydroorotase